MLSSCQNWKTRNLLASLSLLDRLEYGHIWLLDFLLREVYFPAPACWRFLLRGGVRVRVPIRPRTWRLLLLLLLLLLPVLARWRFRGLFLLANLLTLLLLLVFLLLFILWRVAFRWVAPASTPGVSPLLALHVLPQLSVEMVLIEQLVVVQVRSEGFWQVDLFPLPRPLLAEIEMLLADVDEFGVIVVFHAHANITLIICLIS